MDDNQLTRYSRQILLPQIGYEGQQRLLASKVLIIGLGGLGSPVSMYLAGAGIGHMTLVDYDRVELSNLHRQIMHDTQTIDQKKTLSAEKRLLDMNPDLQLELIDHRLSDDELQSAVKNADVVLDCTDNFASRFTINEVCVQQQTPLVSGAAIRLEAQVSVFNQNSESPCYACLFKDESQEQETCSENGVLGPLVGMIGSMQAIEAIKILLNIGETLAGRLIVLDSLRMEWRTIKLKKDPSCAICSA